ncbi:hypothetical protein OSTOST_00481 [Ostertagia ostertagi]
MGCTSFFVSIGRYIFTDYCFIEELLHSLIMDDIKPSGMLQFFRCIFFCPMRRPVTDQTFKENFIFSRSTEKLPRNRLINWLIQFYNLLMAKFSLYFTNVLANFCSVDDLKIVKKADAVCLAIIMDRENCTEKFYGSFRTAAFPFYKTFC